jgi:hypothetical protein
MDQSSGFPQRDLVPDALRDDERITLTQFDDTVAVGEFEANRHRARHHVKKFVSVGVHFSVVRRVAGEMGRADTESVDAMWWFARLLFDEPSVSVAPPDADNGAAQVERLTDRDVHAPYSPLGRLGSRGAQESPVWLSDAL